MRRIGKFNKLAPVQEPALLPFPVVPENAGDLDTDTLTDALIQNMAAAFRIPRDKLMADPATAKAFKELKEYASEQVPVPITYGGIPVHVDHSLGPDRAFMVSYKADGVIGDIVELKSRHKP